jgi:hypothetical protein
MESKDITYKKMLDKLKNLSPELDNREELAQIVNEKIERLSANKNKIRIIRITGIVSGAAVILMFFLLIAENRQTFPSEQISTAKVVTHLKPSWIQMQTTLENKSTAKVVTHLKPNQIQMQTTLENKSTTKVVTHLKSNRIQMQTTLEKISSIVQQKQQRKQLKEMLYISLISNKFLDYEQK